MVFIKTAVVAILSLASASKAFQEPYYQRRSAYELASDLGAHDARHDLVKRNAYVSSVHQHTLHNRNAEPEPEPEPEPEAFAIYRRAAEAFVDVDMEDPNFLRIYRRYAKARAEAVAVADKLNDGSGLERRGMLGKAALLAGGAVVAGWGAKKLHDWWKNRQQNRQQWGQQNRGGFLGNLLGQKSQGNQNRGGLLGNLLGQKTQGNQNGGGILGSFLGQRNQNNQYGGQDNNRGSSFGGFKGSGGDSDDYSKGSDGYSQGQQGDY